MKNDHLTGSTSSRNKSAVSSTQYANVAVSLGRNVEPNCIRLEKDLPGSEGPGRVCEEMRLRLRLIKKRICEERSDAANCLFYTEMIDKATLKHYGNP